MGPNCRPMQPHGSILSVLAVLALAAAPDSLRWQSLRMQHAPFTIPVVSADSGGAPPTQTAWDVGGVLIQHIAIRDSQRGIQIVVRAGPGEGLEGLRSDYPGPQARFSPVTQIRICGQPASRQVVELPEEHIACVIAPGGNHPAHVPAMTDVSVAFQHGGHPTRASFRIETRLLPRYRAAMEHFFATIACVGR